MTVSLWYLTISTYVFQGLCSYTSIWGCLLCEWYSQCIKAFSHWKWILRPGAKELLWWKKGSQVIRGESEEMNRRILLIRGGYENRIPDRSHGITISKQLWSTLLFSYLSCWINPLFLFLFSSPFLLSLSLGKFFISFPTSRCHCFWSTEDENIECLPILWASTKLLKVL